MASKKDYTEVLLEDIKSDIKVILEAIQPLPSIQEDVRVIKNDVVALKDEMKAVKAAVKATDYDLSDHERRITALESA